MRFYVSPGEVFPEKNLIEIKDKKEIHHIRDVMRLKEGLSVEVFNGRGSEYIGDIKRIDKNSIIIDIKEVISLRKEYPFNITLYQAIPKKTKMDFIIEKAVELGVDTIVPIITERTIPVIEEKGLKKIERFKRIVKAAAKQCGRANLPIVSDITYFKEALIDAKKKDLVIFAALDKDTKPLKKILSSIKPKNIAIFVGPEGDFSPKEILMAKGEGYHISSLGKLILRVETASIFILSSINYEYLLYKDTGM